MWNKDLDVEEALRQTKATDMIISINPLDYVEANRIEMQRRPLHYIKKLKKPGEPCCPLAGYPTTKMHRLCLVDPVTGLPTGDTMMVSEATYNKLTEAAKVSMQCKSQSTSNELST